MQTAYQAGWYDDLKAGSDGYWEYCAVLDGRETELCEYLDGKIFRKDDPFWDTYFPPNHFNCRSSVISLSADEVDPKSVIQDGNEYVNKAGLKTGAGFDRNPTMSLDIFLKQQCVDKGVAMPDPNAIPVFKTPQEIQDYIKANYPNFHIDCLAKHKDILIKLMPRIEELALKYPNIIFNFEGMDIRYVQEFLPHLLKSMDGHPAGSLDFLKFVGTYKGAYIVDSWQYGRSNAPGYVAESCIDNSRILILSKKYHKNYADLQTVIEQQITPTTYGIYDNEVKFWSGKQVNVLRIFDHEWGHIEDIIYNYSNDKKILDKFNQIKYSVFNKRDLKNEIHTPIGAYSGFDSNDKSKIRGELTSEVKAEIMSDGFTNANKHSKYIYKIMYNIMKSKGYTGDFPF